jgi:hypothetical protein
MKSPSLIFLPRGGSDEFAEIAKAMREADPVQTSAKIVPIQHTHVEWINVTASHIGLEVLSARGYFLPIALIPLEPFGHQSSFDLGFHTRALFRLSWYGHP